jgi:Flp pilus assembly protein TadG
MIGLRSLARDQDGAAIVEFALIAPVMLLTLFGMFDLGHAMYTKALLQGAIEQSARGSTIEGATTGTLDARVTTAVRRIAPNASIAFDRKSYTNFTDVGQPEEFVDTDSNGICSGGETFEDANANAVWDANQGRTGNGGARDAVLYTVMITYPRYFPIAQLVGQSNLTVLATTTVLRNQPYGLQSTTPATGICP